MSGERERLDRANSYVRGLMDDAERERAERDLETDASFRDAVVEVAERMRGLAAETPPKPTDGIWKAVATRLTQLPHMRPAKPEEPVRPFGRRRSDRFADPAPAPAAKIVTPRPQNAPGLRFAVIASALAVAFALGYLAGVGSVAKTPTTLTRP